MGDLGVIEVDQYLRDIQRDYLDFLDDEVTLDCICAYPGSPL